MSVATSILSQLGGKRFITMTGAKQLSDCGDGLQFKLPAKFANHGINCVKITLTPEDLYQVRFYKIRGTKCDLVSELDGVYCDSLQGVFTSTTGLYTSL